MKKKLNILLGALLVSGLAFGDGLLTGSVTSDTGAPIAGVEVSDGVSVVLTDANGAYEMPMRDNAEFVFVSVPTGYDIPLDANGSPLMYQRVNGEQPYNFTLHRQADGGKADSTHVLLVFGDPQVLNGYDDHRFRAETVEDVLRLKATYPEGTKFYGLCVGDIVWDWYDAHTLQKEYFEAMGFPSFMTIGNHDHNCQATDQGSEAAQDSVADDKFTKVFGPTYYSFNIGAVHYVVLDNVLYTGHNGSKNYNCGLTPEQQDWLQQDLALVENGTPIVVAFHIPTRSMTGVLANMKQWVNKGAVVQHLLSGHTHTNIVSEHSGRLIEHTIAAAEGAFWCSHWCSDGSPNGYMVYETGGQKGYTNWYYKATGYDKDYQMRTFPVNSIDAGNSKTNCVLANVWGYDSKSVISIYENGEKHVMRQFTGIDPKIYDVMLDEGDTRPNYPGSDGGTIASKNPGAGATSHLFYYEPQDPNAEFVVEYTDRFGTTSTQPVLRNMMVASFTQDADEQWVYEQPFNLIEYPNQHSTSLAKGTFVQGHYPEGWYACTSKNVLPSGINTPDWETFNWFRIGNGSHSASGFYNFGNGNPAVKSKNSTQRSLGSLNDASNRSIMYGVLIENNTGKKITSLDISYMGKVWRIGSSATQVDTLLFSYVVLTSQNSLRDLRDRRKYLGEIRTRTFAGLDFVSPTPLLCTADIAARVEVDGEDPANQAMVSGTLPVTINPGEVVLLRWEDNDEQGDDHALAIDDLTVRATLSSGDDDAVVTPTIDRNQTIKGIINGQLVIIRNGIRYDVLGNIL